MSEPATDLIEPMLAKEWEGWPTKDAADHYYLTPKLDGFRCLARIVPGGALFWSRGGKTEPWTQNLVRLGATLARRFGTGDVLDCELMAPAGFRGVGCVKGKHADPAEIDALTLNVFDHLEAGRDPAEESVYWARRERLEWLLRLPLPGVDIVPAQIVRTQEEIMDAYLECIDAGFEGAMLNDPRGSYEAGKRSRMLYKLKPMKTEDAIITGFEVGKGKYAGSMGALICRSKADVSFRIGMFACNDAERAELYLMGNTLQGRWVEFQAQDEGPRPAAKMRHAVYLRLRPDLD